MYMHAYMSFLLGKVAIVGTDPSNAQTARQQFELFQDTSELSDEETSHLMQDLSNLSMFDSLI